MGTALEVSPAAWGDLDRLGALLPDEGKELLPGQGTTAMKMVEQSRLCEPYTVTAGVLDRSGGSEITSVILVGPPLACVHGAGSAERAS